MENTLGGFPLDAMIAQLIQMLKQPDIMDLSQEIKFMAVQCLFSLMDIYPTHINSMVAQGLVTSLCDVMQQTLGYVDLSEACIKGFAKISEENPHAILTSQALQLSLNMIDFFDINTQGKILSVFLNVSRHSASESEVDSTIMPCMPIICSMMQINVESDQQKVQKISSIILRVCESFTRMLSPVDHFERVSALYEKISSAGVVESILSGLQNYMFWLQAKQSQANQDEDSMMEINTTGLQKTSYSDQTVSNFLLILKFSCQYSQQTVMQLISGGILEILETLIPEQEELSEKSYITDALSLLNTLLPASDSETVIECGYGQFLHQTDQPNSRFALFKQAARKLEDEKKQFISSLDESLIKIFSVKLLPKIFIIYKQNIQSNFRIKCLSIIEKILVVIPEQLLTSSLDPVSFSRFIQMIFASGNGQQVLLCLKMLQKVLASDALAFAVPFIREGIKFVIDDFATEESVAKFNAEKPPQKQSPPDFAGQGLFQFLGKQFSKSSKEQTEHEIERLEKRLNDLKEIMDQTDGKALPEKELVMQKYTQALNFLKEKKRQIEEKEGASEEAKPEPKDESKTIGAQIKTEAEQLKSKYLDNPDFEKNVHAKFPEELALIGKYTTLATAIKDEASQASFDFQKTKTLMEQLAFHLTSEHGVTSYEFLASGLLDALDLFLTHSPSQVKSQIDKSQDQEEEVKSPGDLSSPSKESEQISKKEATSLILRLKTFTHVMTTKVNNKLPFAYLITECQDFLSRNESLIFKESSSSNDGPGQLEALKALNRNVIVNLVYDPERKHMIKSKDEDTEMVDEPTLGKAKSVALPFSHLQAGPATQKEEQLEQQKSKVFRKRHKLFQDLKQIPLNLQHCDNIWLLEDFLLKHIRTNDDVKRLVKQTRPAYGTGFFGTAQAEKDDDDLLDEEMSSPMQSCFSRCMERIADLLESAVDQASFHQLSPEFMTEIVNDIASAIAENKVEDHEVDVFFKQMSAETDMMVKDHTLGAGSGSDDDSAALDAHMQNEESRDIIIQSIQAKLMEFFAFIEKIKSQVKTKLKEKVEEMKEAEPKPQEEENKDEPDPNQSPKVSVMPGVLPVVKGDEPVLADSASSADKPSEDVEMTDEQLKLSGQASHDAPVSEQDSEMSVPVSEPKQMPEVKQVPKKTVPKMPVNMVEMKEDDSFMKFDIEELIKDNNGDDIEIEFYHNGQPVELNTSIYEICKKQEEGKLPQVPQKLGPGQHLKELMESMSGAGSLLIPNHRTIYFAIKDKPKQTNPRKDSLAEFAMQRARTRSQAVNDISADSLNLVVQQLIEKEFQVFTTQTDKSANFLNLERCLKILKVLNFIHKNVQLLTNQGINFLLLKSSSEKELKEFQFDDVELQVVVTHELQPLMFHHSKLDANLLKAIQDPYKLVSGGISDILKMIFSSCSFLFPFETKQLYFKLVSFIGVDINRSLYFLKAYVDKKGKSLRQEDRSAGGLFGNHDDQRSKKQKMSKQKCKIDRSKILDEATQIMNKLQKRALLEIEYKNEEGTGQGPTLEFYSLVSDKLKSACDDKLWRSNMPDGSLFPKPLSYANLSVQEVKKVCEVFKLAGSFVAKAITDDRLIDMPISQVMWDLLLGKKMNLFDLQKIDDSLFKLFSEFQVMANRKKEVDEMVLEPEIRTRLLSAIKTSKGVSIEEFGLFFYHPNDDSIELIRDGKQLSVTLDNLQEYIDLVLHATFHETIKLQLQAFKKGFNFILPIETLRPLAYNEEISQLICGEESAEEWKDVNKLAASIVTAHGYSHKSRVFLDFLKYLTELDSDQRKQFMRWICGCPKLPIGGFAALQPRLTVVMKKPENPDQTLPSVMTCQNYVKMPEYSDYETLKLRFDFAIAEGSNNFTLS